MKLIIHNTKSGEILRTGSCPEEMLSIQAQEGETVIEGEANDQTQYIVDGIVTGYTEAELVAKSAIPYGHKWKMPERKVVQELPDEEITAYLAGEARRKRDSLLSACDWTQTADQPDPTKSKWKSYRQALRDVTNQQDFPHVIWPTPLG